MNHWTTKILPELRLYTGDVIELPGYINNPYTVTEDGLNDSNGDHAAAPSFALANGIASFEKLPWKPKKGDSYYHFVGDGTVVHAIFGSSIFDMTAVVIGNYARTEEELRQKEPAILNVLGLPGWIR